MDHVHDTALLLEMRKRLMPAAEQLVVNFLRDTTAQDHFDALQVLSWAVEQAPVFEIRSLALQICITDVIEGRIDAARAVHETADTSTLSR